MAKDSCLARVGAGVAVGGAVGGAVGNSYSMSTIILTLSWWTLFFPVASVTLVLLH